MAGPQSSEIFFDQNVVAHGFLRKPTGQIIVFDPAGSIGTHATSINKDGTVAGYYCSVTLCQAMGFFRSPTGEIKTFRGAPSIFPLAMNLGEVVAGGYYDAQDRHGAFLRTPDGHMVKLRISADTTFLDLNNNGWAVGRYQTSESAAYRGFARRPDGTILKFNDPDGVKGTSPHAINNGQLVTGSYLDANSHHHGFVVRLY